MVKIDNNSFDNNNHVKFASESSDEKRKTSNENKGDQNSSTSFGDNTPQQAFNSSAPFKPLGSLSFGEAGENEEANDDGEQEDESSRKMSHLNNFGTSFGFVQSKSSMFPSTTNSFKNTFDMSGCSSLMVSSPMNS